LTYYHIRYNVYEEAGFPVEKEIWVMFDGPINDFKVKQHLEAEHGNFVSIIVSKEICLQEFELNNQK